MVSFPHCKINLGLNVVSKRADGFHNIETCFYPVPRTDILEIIPSSEFSFAQSGIGVPGREEDNLCVKAYRLLNNDFGIGNVKMHLHKIIPMGAGLGGGSSDAAFTLRLLNSIFNLKLSIESLKKYATQLGSDCSFFIEDFPMIGSGRGEILSPTANHLSGLYLVLIKPDVHVSTAEAYAGIVPQKTDLPIAEILKLPVAEWRGKLKNDFEKSIFKKYPLISQLKEKMYSCGAVYASMSGSGSTVFGLFKKPVDLKKEFPGVDYWSGELK
ncbi:MAG TPA: 4-(cytidine 5'-diphospho)-2-C-methyl-D-erythritol kinase [Cyclobacteriaceae bacterium]|jgi:4-diphosphocytidyl-2-C-methyl-D-erythritol kinase|nr:4-(cytidine 5'-diphospho)-2-C-methyl-D-erythritol kinase [Cyclobacteriaceae bacterium]